MASGVDRVGGRPGRFQPDIIGFALTAMVRTFLEGIEPELYAVIGGQLQDTIVESDSLPVALTRLNAGNAAGTIERRLQDFAVTRSRVTAQTLQ